jgi:hypothetical protein
MTNTEKQTIQIWNVVLIIQNGPNIIQSRWDDNIS